jgi:hypothetical protein
VACFGRLDSSSSSGIHSYAGSLVYKEFFVLVFILKGSLEANLLSQQVLYL